ncbi:unnamed protein product [Orchesella dallaii]|uniref:BTB domain-containing protein n=1 Tax=Orchesella dallaii TaxID=48710 RepID=A0ABP1RMH0_9HEXA
MLISLAKNHPINLRIGKESWESSWRWQITLATDIEPSEMEQGQPENLKKYCEKLKDILGVGKTAPSSRNLCIHFQMSPKFPTKTCIKLHGKVLEKLMKLCGSQIKVMLEVNFNELIQGGEGGNIPGTIKNFSKQFKTSELTLTLPHHQKKSASAEFPAPTNGSCSNSGAFCENIEIPLPENFIDTCNNHRAISDIVSNMIVNIWLAVDDLCINHIGDGFLSLQRTCAEILNRQIYIDAAIVCANGSILPCHQCYLAVRSPVLSTMLKSQPQNTKSIRIEMLDVSEDCVKALLTYLYTLETTEPFQNCRLAVELFQVSHKYEISSLGNHLGGMFSEKSNKWFDANAALDLFRFTRQSEKFTQIKLQMISVLKSKGKLLTESENYMRLFLEDPSAAMEMCTIALTQ